MLQKIVSFLKLFFEADDILPTSMLQPSSASLFATNGKLILPVAVVVCLASQLLMKKSGPEIVISGPVSQLNGHSNVDAWFLKLELVLARQPKKMWLETVISFLADDLFQQFIEAQDNVRKVSSIFRTALIEKFHCCSLQLVNIIFNFLLFFDLTRIDLLCINENFSSFFLIQILVPIKNIV